MSGFASGSYLPEVFTSIAMRSIKLLDLNLYELVKKVEQDYEVYVSGSLQLSSQIGI